MESSQGATGPTRYRPGASVHKYGGLGYVGFAKEVRAQEKQLGFGFDYIVVCTVTGSTHAGMLVGFAKDGRQRNVLGIDASATAKQAAGAKYCPGYCEARQGWHGNRGR